MRYITNTSLEETLCKGKALEQFLGGRTSASGELVVSWVELRPTSDGVEVWHFEVPDLGEGFADLYELISEEQDRSVLVASPDAAMQFAQAHFGASATHWVNQSLVQDEFLDFVRAGRIPIRRIVSV
jgi:hypothetical protein